MKTVKLLKKNRLPAVSVAVPYQGLIGDEKSDFKCDFGCGPNKKQGFLGFDSIKFPNVDFTVDLRKPWPISNNCVGEAHSSHFVEHLNSMERVHFFNELYRVMKVGAKATIITPHWSSCRAYGDPTHQWPPCGEFMWFYLKREWRMANAPHTDCHPRGLDPHNNGGKTGEFNLNGFNCNFDAVWGFSLEPGVAQRNQEYQQYAMVYLTEARQDMIATLTKS